MSNEFKALLAKAEAIRSKLSKEQRSALRRALDPSSDERYSNIRLGMHRTGRGREYCSALADYTVQSGPDKGKTKTSAVFMEVLNALRTTGYKAGDAPVRTGIPGRDNQYFNTVDGKIVTELWTTPSPYVKKDKKGNLALVNGAPVLVNPLTDCKEQLRGDGKLWARRNETFTVHAWAIKYFNEHLEECQKLLAVK